MKTVHIIGIGMSAQSATVEAVQCIEQADVLIGAPRMLEAFSHLNKPSYSAYHPDAVFALIDASDQTRFAVLVSGDVGFYSAASAILERLTLFDVQLIPGVSAVSALCAKCKLPWHDAALMSLHANEGDIVSCVRRHAKTVCLTGNNVHQIGRVLCEAGMGALTVYVGEHLGYEDECIRTMQVRELATCHTAPLCTLLIENDAFDARARSGVPDDAFIRGNDVPMTKSEVRAITLSKLDLSPKSICYDVGAGTGSVTVEMALNAYRGHVYAIDSNPRALELVAQNCTRFRIGNVTQVLGRAPQILVDLPAPDAAFIGGSGGEMESIVEALLQKNPRVRLVANAVMLESAYDALEAFSRAGVNGVELVQVSVARAKPVAGRHMLLGQNPVFLISGGGGRE